MKRTVVMLVAGFALLVGGRQVFAHHSFSAEYDSAQKVEIQGVVTQFVWRNPHSFMMIDVTDKDGRPRAGRSSGVRSASCRSIRSPAPRSGLATRSSSPDSPRATPWRRACSSRP
jgi:hypothetical protein